MPVSGYRTAAFALCAALFMGGAALAQQQPQAQQPAQQRGTGNDDIIGFVNDAGTVAGALSVCNPEGYTAVRLCSILIVSHWEALGNTLPRDRARMSERIEQSWRRAAGRARDLQAGGQAPTDCETLQRAARALPFWQTCEAARRLQAAADERLRPAQPQARPAAPRPSAPPSAPPSGGGAPPRTEQFQLQ